ncbi:hypothetical protein BDR03DRAFT_1018965 [Suillus americanus]|nr:hypothetical protein BDR03DRAFT_1018965 [Suillus americanus]
MSNKAVALFNANQHDEAILCVHELATTHPDLNSLACGIIEIHASILISDALGLALEGSGLEKTQARPFRRAWAWLGLGSGLGQGS